MGAVPFWPGAHAAEIRGAEIVIGRLDTLAAALPASPSHDLIDAGRRRGEQLRLFLRRRAALRLLVGRRLDADPAAVVLGYDKRGAPVVRAPAARLRVSVSARGELAGFALAGGPVGIDIEPLVDPGPIDLVLTPAEQAAVAAAPDPGRARLDRWTAKEAYLKALGTGLSRDPADLDVVPWDGEAFGMRDRTRMDSGAGSWFVADLAGAAILAAVWTSTSGRSG